MANKSKTNAILKGLDILVKGGASIYQADLRSRENELNRQYRKDEIEENRRYNEQVRQEENQNKLNMSLLSVSLNEYNKLDAQVNKHMKDFKQMNVNVDGLISLDDIDKTKAGIGLGGQAIADLADKIKVAERNKAIYEDKIAEMGITSLKQERAFKDALSTIAGEDLVVDGNELNAWKQANLALAPYGWAPVDKVYKETFGNELEAEKEAQKWREKLVNNAFDEIDKSYTVLQTQFAKEKNESDEKASKKLGMDVKTFKAFQSVFSVPDSKQLMSNLIQLSPDYINTLRRNPVTGYNFKNIETHLKALETQRTNEFNNNDKFQLANIESALDNLVSKDDYLIALDKANENKTADEIINNNNIFNDHYQKHAGGSLFSNYSAVEDGETTLFPNPVMENQTVPNNSAIMSPQVMKADIPVDKILDSIKNIPENFANSFKFENPPTTTNQLPTKIETNNTPEIDFTKVPIPTSEEVLGDYANRLADVSAYEDSLRQAELDSTSLAEDYEIEALYARDIEQANLSDEELNRSLLDLDRLSKGVDTSLSQDYWNNLIVDQNEQAKRDTQYEEMFFNDPRMRDYDYFIDTVDANTGFREWANRNKVSYDTWDY